MRVLDVLREIFRYDNLLTVSLVRQFCKSFYTLPLDIRAVEGGAL